MFVGYRLLAYISSLGKQQLPHAASAGELQGEGAPSGLIRQQGHPYSLRSHRFLSLLWHPCQPTIFSALYSAFLHSAFSVDISLTTLLPLLCIVLQNRHFQVLCITVCSSHWKKTCSTQTSQMSVLPTSRQPLAQRRGFCYPWEITSHFSASISQSPSDNLSQPWLHAFPAANAVTGYMKEQARLWAVELILPSSLLICAT